MVLLNIISIHIYIYNKYFKFTTQKFIATKPDI